jgi:hypothetical protein
VEVFATPATTAQTKIVSQIKENKDDVAFHSTLKEINSPIVTVTPIIPTVYTPLLFSPYPEFGGFFLYKSQSENDQNRFFDTKNIPGFNPFGFNILMHW